MFKCEYCKKSFTRESTLAVHMCEQKRRALAKDDKQVKMGLITYNIWNRIAMGARTDKTYEQFSSSKYYSAFVKFGGYILSIRSIEPDQYIKWLTHNRVPLSDWCKDSIYNKYIADRSKTETADRAVERFILLADKWATETNQHWQDFWDIAPPHQIVHYISMGKISPWVLYSSDKAQNFLDGLPAEMLQEIANTLDPDFWIRKTKLYPQDVKFIRDTIG